MEVKLCGIPWNPCTGCTKTSPGCKYCYAQSTHERLWVQYHMVKYAQPFNTIVCHEHVLAQIPRKGKPKTYFMSMSDPFHKSVPLSFLKKIFAVANECPQHTFQFLTKRSSLLVQKAKELVWTPNIWMGVSIENQDYVYRADDLRKVPAHIKWLSCEPLLGPLVLDLTGINWVIAGGESGTHFRPMKLEWVRDIRMQCSKAKVAFAFAKEAGNPPFINTLDGEVVVNYPQ